MRRFLLIAAGVALAVAAVAAAASAAPTATDRFPDCYNHAIVVGSRTVYAGAPARCNTTTTTTVPATTSTTLPPETTETSVVPTSTTPTSSTTTTPPVAGCGLAVAAFCETFDSPHPVAGTRSGDLDPVVWGVSRINTYANPSQGEYNTWLPATLDGRTVRPPNDVRIIDGQLHEAVNDGEGQPSLAMYPKQPFNFAGRTGTVTFDVSADAEGIHAAWPEFWITDQPVPSPHAGLSGSFPYARNSVGFAINSSDCGAGRTRVGEMFASSNYQMSSINFTAGACIVSGHVGGALNHFEVRISPTRIEVWGTDAGASTLKLTASANRTMPLTQGLVWMEDVHYNADKFGTQGDHEFAWDNLGFDGPKTYRDRTFDVADSLGTPSNPVDAGRINLGYPATTSGGPVLHANVHFEEQTPTASFVDFNWYATTTAVPDVRVNGGAWHKTAWPFDGTTYGWRTIAVPVDLSEIHEGDNTIQFRNPSGEIVVSNINIVLVNAAPVPT
jgi:hypothetical protein